MLPEITDEYLMELEALLNSDELIKLSTDIRIEKLAYNVRFALFGIGEGPKQPVTIHLSDLVSAAAKGIDKLRDFVKNYINIKFLKKAIEVGNEIAALLKNYTHKDVNQRNQVAGQLIAKVPEIQPILYEKVTLMHPSDPNSVRLELDRGYGMKSVPAPQKA